MKKRMGTALIAGMLLLGLTACGSSTEELASSADLESLQAQVQELQDQADIKALSDQFSNLADAQDAQTQALLFTEDAQVVIRFGGQENVLDGREQIAEVFGGVITGMDALYHMNGQTTIEVDGGTATGTVYCRVALVNTADGVTTLTDEAVTYEDEYVRQDGQWLISKRISNFIFTDGHEMATAPNE